MKKVVILFMIIIIGLVACKKKKNICFQSTNTFDYYTLNQHDTTIVQVKVCLEESLWPGITFEDTYDDSTGDYRATDGQVGTKSTVYFNSVRNDSVLRTTETLSVPE